MDQLKEVAVTVHETSLSLISTIPDEVYARANILIKTRVKCNAGCNLHSGKVKIVDHQGDLVIEVKLSSETNEFNIQAPNKPGKYTWTAIFEPQEKETVLHQESSNEFSFKVKPHRISLSVWGIPSPVSAGEKFTLNIGAKCSAGCSLAGLPFTIKDGDQNPILSDILGEDVLPQTSGTYWTEEEFDAPTIEAINKWCIESDGSGIEWEHEICSTEFVYRTAAPPKYSVTVEVTNTDNQTPINEAYVMLGLHKATTDKNGIASLRVPDGKQELCVTKLDYLLFQKTVEITGDVNLTAQLVYFPEF